MVPVRVLKPKSMVLRVVRLMNEVGMEPVKLLLLRRRYFNFIRVPMKEGIGPNR
jgi:hypothetical protein